MLIKERQIGLLYDRNELKKNISEHLLVLIIIMVQKKKNLIKQ